MVLETIQWRIRRGRPGKGAAITWQVAHDLSIPRTSAVEHAALSKWQRSGACSKSSLSYLTAGAETLANEVSRSPKHPHKACPQPPTNNSPTTPHPCIHPTNADLNPILNQYLDAVFAALPPFQSTVPPTSLISCNVVPNLTTLNRTIRGSSDNNLLTPICACTELSKRMIKWWPRSCLARCLRVGPVSRKTPQLVMPRTTPPELRTRAPAVRQTLRRVLDEVGGIGEWRAVVEGRAGGLGWGEETDSLTSAMLPWRTCAGISDSPTEHQTRELTTAISS